MLIAGSKCTTPGRSLHSQHAVTVRALGGTSGAAGILPRQQTRRFRFGGGSDWRGDDISREIRRQRHMLKRASEHLNRRLPWEKHPFAEDSRHVLRGFMQSYWKRFSDDMDPVRKGSDTDKSTRPGQNIEDVERFGMEDEPVSSQQRDRGRRREHDQSRKLCNDTTDSQTGYDLPIEHDGFYIDPITNRKVAKQTRQSDLKDDAETPTKTFRDYRSRFINNLDLSRHPDALSTTRLVKPRSGGYKYSQDLRKLKPETEKATLAYTDSGRYDELLRSRYRPFADSELDKNLNTSAEKLSNDFDSRRDYRHAIEGARDEFNDLKPPYENIEAEESKYAVADELSSRVQTAAESGEAAANSRGTENDMHFEHTEPLSYDPTRYEPLEPEDQTLGNDELVTPELLRQYRYSIETTEPDHSTETTAKDLRAKYGEAEWQQYNNVEASNLEAKMDPTTQEFSERQSLEDDYGPYYHNEPDSLQPSTDREISHGFPPLPEEEKTELPPLSAEEETELPPLPLEEETELPALSAEEETKLPPLPAEGETDLPPLPAEESYQGIECLYRYDDPRRFEQQLSSLNKGSNRGQWLSEARDHDNADPKNSGVEESWAHEDEMGRPQTVRSNLAPNGEHNEHQPMSVTAEELSHLLDSRENLYRFENPAQEESVPKVEHDGSSPVASTGNEAISSRCEAPQTLNSVYRGEGREAKSLGRNTPSKPESQTDSLYRAELLESLSSVLEDPAKLKSIKQGQRRGSSYWDQLESSAKAYEQQSDCHDEQAASALKSAKSKTQVGGPSGQKMTGNYVRDFPEDFEKNWRQTLSSVPTDQEQSYEIEAPATGECMDGGLEGAFGRPSPAKIQPALHRHNKTDNSAAEQEDAYSKDPQGLETSYYEDCGEATQPLLVKQYGTASGAENGEPVAAKKATQTIDEDKTTEFYNITRSETSSASDKEPVLYKILAWDPTMQSINIAETSSMVPDFTSALSPADALLRLSHPTKFFPHFASLEAEGFEILSGSGDVLVFRKVRPSKPTQIESTSKNVAEQPLPTQSAEQSQSTFTSAQATHVNPIDMTGRAPAVPASANFASPTGYVKYDHLPETVASNLPPPPPPPPRVAYNINLRREEPVYSGPKFKAHAEQKQRPGVFKRLILGGFWVAGISYGLGVIGEYFTTADASAPHDWDKKRK